MSMISNTESGIRIPGMSSRFLDSVGSRDHGQGRLRYLTGGSGSPLVLLHTVRTQAEHLRHLIPLVQQRYTVYAHPLPTPITGPDEMTHLNIRRRDRLGSGQRTDQRRRETPLLPHARTTSHGIPARRHTSGTSLARPSLG